MPPPKTAPSAPEGEIESLIGAIRANPLELGRYPALAKAFVARGESRRAEFTLLRVIEIEPLYGDAWLELGALYSTLGEWVRSANAYERASALQSGNVSAWVGYAMALIAAQDLTRAVEVSNTLLQRFPLAGESHLVAGHISKVRGEFADATRHYCRAIDIDPRQTEAIFNFVDLSPPHASDVLTKKLDDLRRDDALLPQQRAEVSFALARIYERSGEVDRAFALYEEANAAADAMMQTLGSAYDAKELEKDADRIIELFSADVVAQRLEPLDLDLKMIFVVGLPRSGTTLVERVIGDSHPHVSVGGELPFMQECLAALMAGAEASDTQAGSVIGTDRGMLRRLRQRYLDGLFERELDGEFVTDKLPVNFRALGLIRMLFPDARIVHCVRDPIATCWSLYTAYFGAHLPYYTSLERLAHYYKRVYLRLMTHWRSLLPGEIIDVEYEDLVGAPQETIPALLDACGLPRGSGCGIVDEARRPIYTASMIQARQPIYTTSVSRWRAFEKHLSPLIDRLKQ